MYSAKRTQGIIFGIILHEMITTFCYKTPIGNLEIATENNAVISAKFINKFENANCESTFTKSIKTQLSEYFSGLRKDFDLKIKPKGTDFQKRVWRELIKIPYGETKSYTEIAQSLGNSNSSRAVGNACNKNPAVVFIPCHRVISKNGNLSGYAYGAEIKQKLLDIERRNTH